MRRFAVVQISHSLVAYRAIRERILAVEIDLDEETLTDSLEGITDLNEVVAAVVRSALVDEALAEGLKGHIETMQSRLRRLSERAQARRQIARDAMVEVDLKKITAPDLTISIRPGTSALVVTEEGCIPEPYWLPREPRLDRLGLLNDLKRGVEVEGAALSNPAPVLSVRVR
jgi:hypothetical protein